jgi:hypothetical protein
MPRKPKKPFKLMYIEEHTFEQVWVSEEIREMLYNCGS